jgi:hypothetical protein
MGWLRQLGERRLVRQPGSPPAGSATGQNGAPPLSVSRTQGILRRCR